MDDKEKEKENPKKDPQFPRSIEGPRGDKDSAFESKKLFEDQREFGVNKSEEQENDSNNQKKITNMENTNFPPNDDTQFETNYGALGESIEERDEMEAFDLPPGIVMEESIDPDDSVGKSRDLASVIGNEIVNRASSSSQTISITSIRTSSQHGNTLTFLRTWDALAFIITIHASQALVNSGRKFDANYQIIDYDTNTVVKSIWRNDTGFNWGSNFWISQGNNWGPERSNYDTPAKWGFGTGLYIFRATVEVQGTGAFSYSRDHVFRVR